MSLCIRIDYLTGRCVATDFGDFESAEWPPHPGRLFSALVAAYAECGFGQAERDALLWLEHQTPPSISFSKAPARDVVPVYVPVNDQYGPGRPGKKGFSAGQVREGLAVMPDKRSRQQRFFPSVTPRIPTVYFRWQGANETEVRGHRESLARLAESVPYLGHSSSLVRVGLVSDLPDDRQRFETLVPAGIGEVALRVPSRGRFESLEAAFRRGLRPGAGMFCAYSPASKLPRVSAPGSDRFGDFIVFEKVQGPTLNLTKTIHLTTSVRRALLERAEQPVMEVLSGHTPSGRASEIPHVTIVPLSNVGYRYSDGTIHGFAVVLPGSLSDEERAHVYGALRRDEDEFRVLSIRGFGRWTIGRATFDSPRDSLRTDRYRGPSRHWASVTPVILDRFPKGGLSSTDIVAASCDRVGLKPIEICVERASLFRGVAPSLRFDQPPSRDGKPRRLHSHVSLRFAEPVTGPILLGAGRFLGLGLFLPVRDDFSREIRQEGASDARR